MDAFDLSLETGLLSTKPSILIPASYSPTETNTKIQLILNNHPEMFWFQGKWRLVSKENADFVVPVYSFPMDEIAQARERLNIVAEELSKVDGSEMERAKIIFIRLLKWCDYGAGTYGGQTAYDALVLQSAYCKGLSKAYQLLMQKIKIPCRLISGQLWHQGRHIWNEIQIDGKWYEVDLSTAYSNVRRTMKILSPVFAVKSSELPDCYNMWD